MFIIVDIVIILILSLCILMGYRRGLAGCLIRILSFIIAIIIATMLFKPVSAIIVNNTQTDENIQSSIVEMFEKEENNDEKEDNNNSPIMKYISAEVEKATEEKKKEIVNDTAKEISYKIIDILAFIGLFILARIILSFIKILANLITRLPIIKQCDKIGGVAYGIIQGLVIIFILLALITFISPIINQYYLLELVNKSYVGSILNNNNLLVNIIF